MNWAAILYAYFLAAIVLDHAHLVCPIALGWGNRGFRHYMLARPGMVLLPAFAVGMAVIIGLGSHSTREPTFRMLALTYIGWNAWHFGSQHFGIASLLGWRSGPRWLRQVVLIVPTMTLILAPALLVGRWVALLVLGELVSFVHWTTDIGLSCSRRTWAWGALFLGAILCLGAIGFLWKTTSHDPRICGLMPVCTAVWSVPTLVSLRYGLGFWHFLMSRWVWSSEGRALLRAA